MSEEPIRKPLEKVRVGLVGSGFMARTHSSAYAGLRATYGDALPGVECIRVADITEELARSAATRLGWREASGDWREVTRADDLELVDIVTPNHVHAEIAVDAARHGKHLLCEKPLAHSVDDARAMYEEAERAGVAHQVAFVYRKWPAIELARKLVGQGKVGRVLHFRAHFFHDYALDPDLAVTWRLQRALAGGGSLIDLGSHLIDLARFLVGDVDRVLARSRTIYERRPVSAGPNGAEVDVDDSSDLLLEFENGASGVLSTSWVATGYKMDLAFEVLGERGSLRFSWERNGELEYYSHGDPAELQGYQRIVIGPQHRGADAFWPNPGMGIGYGDAFLIQAHDLVSALHAGTDPEPTFLDGLRVAEVVAAAQESAEAANWSPVAHYAAV